MFQHTYPNKYYYEKNKHYITDSSLQFNLIKGDNDETIHANDKTIHANDETIHANDETIHANDEKLKKIYMLRMQCFKLGQKINHFFFIVDLIIKVILAIIICLFIAFVSYIFY